MICLRLVSIHSRVMGTAPGLFIAVRKTYIRMNFEIYKSKFFIDFKVKNIKLKLVEVVVLVVVVCVCTYGKDEGSIMDMKCI